MQDLQTSLLDVGGYSEELKAKQALFSVNKPLMSWHQDLQQLPT